MNTADSAEELVKIYLDGIEMALRITGTGAKNVAVWLIATAKTKEQTRGKTRLSNLLRTGKPLKIFTISADELKKFSQEAKKYGILYCALADKSNSKIDGMVDIMIKEEDASKMNRIAERFNFKDIATIKEEREREKQEKLERNKGKSEDEIFIDEIMPVSKEQEKQIPSNNTKETEEKSLSEISSNINHSNKLEEKPSVLKEIKEITEELKEKENLETINQEKEIAPAKEKGKGGKRYKEKPKKEHKKMTINQKGKRYKEPKHLKEKNKKSKGRSK